MSDTPTRAEYLENPTMFWTIALLDLGCAGLGSFIAAIGMLRRQPWARIAAYAILDWYAFVSIAVAAMAITMLVKDDESASLPGTIAFSAFATVFSALAVALYRTALAKPSRAQPEVETAASFRLRLRHRRA